MMLWQASISAWYQDYLERIQSNCIQVTALKLATLVTALARAARLSSGGPAAAGTSTSQSVTRLL